MKYCANCENEKIKHAMQHITLIAGARPNFIKIAPFILAQPRYFITFGARSATETTFPEPAHRGAFRLFGVQLLGGTCQSGGYRQRRHSEETTVRGVPCITLRDNTERPETCTIGTNELIGTRPEAIKPALDLLFA